MDVRTEVRLNEHANEAIMDFARDLKPALIALSRRTRIYPVEWLRRVLFPVLMEA